MANPFYVQPANYLPGIQALAEGVGNRLDYMQQKNEETQKQQVRQKVSSAMQQGNSDEVYKLAIENPWLSDELKKSTSFHNDSIQADAIESAKKILLNGESPSQVGISHAEKIINQGGDASAVIQGIKEAQQDPESAKKKAATFLALYDPKSYEAWIKTQPGNETPKIGSISPDKYTGASIQKFKETGNFEDLVPREGADNKPPADLRSFEMAHYGGVLSNEERSNLVKSGQYEKDLKQFGLDTKTSSYDIPEEGIANLVDAVSSGQEATANLPKRGKTFAAVESGVLAKYPKFNFTMNNANSKYRNDSNILRSAGLVNAAMPRVYKLLEKAKNLENTFGVPALDQPLNKIKREFGSEKVTDFESLRNAVLFEVNTALSGSSVPSDYRIKIELDNMKSGLKLGQQIKSITNLIDALNARKDASTMNAYPLDVVRGERTLDQWRKDTEKESKINMNSYLGEEPNQGTSASGGIPSIKTDEEYNSLPSGTEFIAPDGSRRRKP